MSDIRSHITALAFVQDYTEFAFAFVLGSGVPENDPTIVLIRDVEIVCDGVIHC